MTLTRLPVSDWQNDPHYGPAAVEVGRKNAVHRRSRAGEGSRLLVLTETRRRREGGLHWVASLSHTNLTTLMALRVYHEGHEEHEAIRQQTEHALWKSSTAGGGVTFSYGGWHRTAAALRVSVAL